MIIVLLLLVCLSLQCTLDVAGGTSTTDNPKIIGTIVHTNSQPASNTIVEIIPHDYNPCINDLPGALLRDTTDNNGKYEVTVSRNGIYNIQAVHEIQGTGFLKQGIVVDGKEDTVSVPQSTLRSTGVLQIFLPDTVDTINGYIYIKGTTISKDLYGGVFYTGGFYAVIIDSVPPESLPPVILASRKTAFIPIHLSDSTTVAPGDTAIIGTDSIQKPLWTFPLIVGATARTVEYYKGFDSIKVKILNQISMVSKYFNDPKVFNGVFEFRVDSVYQFSTSAEEEVKQPIGRFAVRLIYDEYGLPYLPYWRSSNRVIYAPVNVGNGEDLFNAPSTRSLAWAFGMSRGCPPQYELQVQANKNPINGEPYFGLESIMNSPTQYLTWDTLSINIINYYKNSYSILPEIINDVFPASMGVKAKTTAGQAVQGAKIDLFGVKWGSYTVCDTPVVSGVTDSTGLFKFVSNPFAIGNIVEYELVYSNFLIRAINISDTVFTWMPITDVGNAWFANPNALFTVKMVFQ